MQTARNVRTITAFIRPFARKLLRSLDSAHKEDAKNRWKTRRDRRDLQTTFRRYEDCVIAFLLRGLTKTAAAWSFTLLRCAAVALRAIPRANSYQHQCQFLSEL